MTKAAGKRSLRDASAAARPSTDVGLGGEVPENRRIPILKIEPTILDLHRRVAAGTLSLHRSFAPTLSWSTIVQSRLIESVLLRLPLPALYMAESRAASLVIIDGLQRLLSLFAFLEGRLALTGLELLPELDGKRFADLPVRMRRRFEDTTLTVMVVNLDAGDWLQTNVFLRLNSPSEDDPSKGE